MNIFASFLYNPIYIKYHIVTIVSETTYVVWILFNTDHSPTSTFAQCFYETIDKSCIATK